MTRPRIIASALTVLLAAACTRAPASGAAPGGSAPAVQPPPPTSPSTHPGAPIPGSRTPQPAPDTAPPSPSAPVPAHPVGSPDTTSSQAGQRADSAHIAALEREARALAKTTGCTRDDQCRNAPVGVKACGGPEYYLKYCAASTDSVALYRVLARIDAAERAYNAKYHVMSTCQMMLPTRPHVVGGACH